jgi:nucleoside-diphosphate-sugar epimerase
VVGASGFVGRELCRQLQDAGHFVRAMHRTGKTGPWDEQVLLGLDQIEGRSEEVFTGIDTVFYLASVAHNKARPDLYHQVNVVDFGRFIEAASKQGVDSLIYVSSTKAMAEPGSVVADESFSDRPDDDYGLSKLEAEQCLIVSDAFNHWSILRPCLVYGRGVQGNLADMLKMVDRGLFPAIPETGHRRSMVAVGDVCAALICLASDFRAHRQLYLVTDHREYSTRDIYLMMRETLGKGQPLCNFPLWILNALGFVGDVLSRVLGKFPITSDRLYKLLGPALFDASKISRELGWKPSRTFQDVLPEMIDSHRNQGA